MHRLSLLFVAGFALLAAGTAPASGDAAPDEPEATLTIDYQQTRGDMRRATVSIVLSSETEEPNWRKDLANISVLTTDGRWIVIDRLLSSGDGATVLEARAMLPPPEDIAAIIMIDELGTATAWSTTDHDLRTMEREPYTFLDQNGRGIPQPAPLANNGDDCGPIPAGCEVYNPFDCTCDVGLKDPFGLKVSGDQIVLSI